LPAGLAPEDFPITSYDVSDDGQSVRGEAVSMDVAGLFRGDAVEPTPGSFSITCPSG